MSLDAYNGHDHGFTISDGKSKQRGESKLGFTYQWIMLDSLFPSQDSRHWRRKFVHENQIVFHHFEN